MADIFSGTVWEQEGRKRIPIPKRKTIEKKLRQNAKGRCMLCNKINFDADYITPHIHHIDGKPWNNDFDNFELVCPNCHSKRENEKSFREAQKKKRTKRRSNLSDLDYLRGLGKIKF